METSTPEKPPKARMVIYVDPALHQWLWNRRAQTSRPVSAIAEDLMVEAIEQIEMRRALKEQSAAAPPRLSILPR